MLDARTTRARRLLPMVAAAGAREPRIEPRSARISVTDRCDFACTYCRPSRSDGYVREKLSLERWQVMIDGLVAAKVQRFRLTGGEPLIHPQIVDFVRMIARHDVADVALTTNASQLEKLARPLAEAGLRRINISIDTLDPDRFTAITRGGRLDEVLRGIDAAIDAGLSPIKLNTVVLRGVNDDELEPIVRFAWARDMVPRFLEVMPIAEGAKLAQTHLVTAAEMRARLAHMLLDESPQVEHDRGPAKYLRSASDASKRVGFISGTSDTYCGTCDRLRVSSTGVLRPCLATDDGVDASLALDAADAGAIGGLLEEAWQMKPDGRIFKGCTEESAAAVSMRSIGG